MEFPFSILAGIVIGFLMAAPIGAVGILSIQRTLQGSRRRGSITGLGGATADFLFCLASGSGIQVIAGFIAEHRAEIRLVGGLLLLLMGLFLLRAPSNAVRKPHRSLEKTGDYLSAFVLALTNPLVMFSYAGLIAIITHRQTSFLTLTSLSVGVFAGSFLWFVFITNLAHRLRERLTLQSLGVINRSAGILLLLIGISAFYDGIRSLN